MSKFPEHARLAIRGELAKSIPAFAVDQVLDLAIHAADEAFDAAERVLTCAPSPNIETCALSLAISLINNLSFEMMEKLEEQAHAQGHIVRRADVNFGGAR